MHQQPIIPCYSLLLQPNLLAECCQYLSYTEMCSLLTGSPQVRMQLSLQKDVSFEYKLSILRLFLLKDVERYNELLERDILSQEDLDQLVFYKIYGENPSIYFFQALASGVVTPVQLMAGPFMLGLLNENDLAALSKGVIHFENLINEEHKIRRSQYEYLLRRRLVRPGDTHDVVYNSIKRLLERADHTVPLTHAQGRGSDPSI